MKNFQEILAQLDQSFLPFFCDEALLHMLTVVEIILNCPDEFSNLYTMMGMSHMAKAALHCAGKILAGSGIDTALIKTKIFGELTLESVLSGGHYVRALKGILIIRQAIRSLQWKAFWHLNKIDAYDDLISDAVYLVE